MALKWVVSLSPSSNRFLKEVDMGASALQLCGHLWDSAETPRCAPLGGAETSHHAPLDSAQMPCHAPQEAHAASPC